MKVEGFFEELQEAEDIRQEWKIRIRAHWVVESFHWHLDVTFREDANHT